MARMRIGGLTDSIREPARALARTGERVAATFGRLAEPCPQDAERPAALSLAA